MKDYTNLYCRVKYSPSQCWQQVTLLPTDFCELIEYMKALEAKLERYNLSIPKPTPLPDTIGMNTNATNNGTGTASNTVE
jgi:hypothetical protein